MEHEKKMDRQLFMRGDGGRLPCRVWVKDPG